MRFWQFQLEKWQHIHTHTRIINIKCRCCQKRLKPRLFPPSSTSEFGIISKLTKFKPIFKSSANNKADYILHDKCLLKHATYCFINHLLCKYCVYDDGIICTFVNENNEQKLNPPQDRRRDRERVKKRWRREREMEKSLLMQRPRHYW